MSTTEKESEDASSKKRLNTCANDSPSPWSDLNHDMLFSVMMKLRVFDFPAFSGVCKSWRSFALSNKNKFMESRPPLFVAISTVYNEENYNCYLEELEGRMYKTMLPHSGGRTCVGSASRHLIFFGRKTNDFWLLDPIKRHGVHFPDIPSSLSDNPKSIRGVLVFSPSKSGWLFVMTNRSTNIWFSMKGQGAWNHVSTTSRIVDIHLANGKLYAIDNARHLCELTLNPQPKLMVLETKNFPNFPACQQLCSSHGNLCVVGYSWKGFSTAHKLDFEEMIWVPCKLTTRQEGLFRISKLMQRAVGKCGIRLFVWKHMVHDHLNGNIIDW